jgi:uncharacterized membrane protein
MLLGKEVVLSLQIKIIVNTYLYTILVCIVDMLIFVIILVTITLYYEYRKTVEDLGCGKLLHGAAASLQTDGMA